MLRILGGETFRTLLMAIFVAVFFRSCAYEPFHIPSGSMKSTLLIGDYLFVSKYTYGYSRYSFPFGLDLFHGRVLEFVHPQRGDIVVFRPPGDPGVDYIKRVMGVPGDRLQVKEGVVYINGQELKRERIDDFLDDENKEHVVAVPRFDETLLSGKIIQVLKQRRYNINPIDPQDDVHTADDTPEFDIPPGHYFMMGDNRDNSHDSRFSDMRYVPEENLVGRAELIFFSTDGSASWLNPVSWFTAMRFSRFFTLIH